MDRNKSFSKLSYSNFYKFMINDIFLTIRTQVRRMKRVFTDNPGETHKDETLKERMKKIRSFAGIAKNSNFLTEKGQWYQQ